MVEESKSWDVMYREHGPALLRYFARRFGPSALPEDLLQDTFLQAIRNPDRLERAGSPRAWLFGIARHVGLTALRKRRPFEPISSEIAAESEASVDLRQEAVRSAIDGLSETLRVTLELRLQHDLSYEEIAEMLEIPVGTVRSRLHHAVRRLREEVANVPGQAATKDHS